jgi:4-amino-4-deoxy-L-arabinose transferase-like glycosyltransferase
MADRTVSSDRVLDVRKGESRLTKSERNYLGFILLLALVLRVAAALYLGGTVSGLSGAQDEVSYSLLGQRFVDGHGLTFPTAWYPWISADAPQSYYSASMSLLLAGIYSVFGYKPLVARLIFALMGTAIVGMIFLLARRLFDTRVAVVAGLIAAGYSYLVFYSVTLVTETPFILVLLVSIYLAYELHDSESTWKWFALGISMAVMLLFRMAVVFYLPVLLIWILYARRQHFWRALIPIVIVILAVAPFTYENHQRWGRFMLLEAQFGHVFWNGNHPDHDWDFHPYEVFPIPDEVLASRNDAEITSALLKLGIENVIDQPLHFLALTVTRLRELFTFWPTSDSTLLANSMRVLSFGIVLPFAIFGLWRSASEWRRLLPIYAFMLLHVGIYSVTWTMIRYRIPMDALLIIFGAVGLMTLLEHFNSERGLVSGVFRAGA